MTYNSRRDYSKNSDLATINERLITNMENYEDEDIYISERSSVASTNELNEISTPTNKRLPTPGTSIISSIPQKQPQTLRYAYNELPDNGLVVVTQYQPQQKEEKKQKKKDPCKVPLRNGHLIPFPETKPLESGENYYPHWYYHRVKNPDWTVRPGQTVSHDPFDSSQSHQPALTTLPIKPQQQPTRKSRHPHVPIIHSNQDKQRSDHSENNSNASTHLTTYENLEISHSKRRSSPKLHIPFKESDHDEHRIQPVRRTISQQRRKVKNEIDWTENHLQSITNGRLSQNSNSLIITSNPLTSRVKHRSKLSDKISNVSDIDEHGKYRPPPNHYHSHQTPSHNSPAISTHHHPLHVRRRPPSGTHHSSDIHVVDVSFKKPERTPFIQQTRDPFNTPIPPVFNQTPHLPLIVRDHHQQKTHSPRFPTEYYGTLARQAHGKNWEEPTDIPRIYKPDPQTRFYDRYLHNTVDKRLVA